MSLPLQTRVLLAGDTLTRAEVHRLLMRAKRTQRTRDYLLLLLLHRYRLSSTDVVRLRRDHFDLVGGRLLMKRTFRMVACRFAAKDLQDIKSYLASRRDLGPWMFVSRNGRGAGAAGGHEKAAGPFPPPTLVTVCRLADRSGNSLARTVAHQPPRREAAYRIGRLFHFTAKRCLQ